MPSATPPRTNRQDAARKALKKPTPWGLIAASTALVLLLGGILGYAVLNTGASSPVIAGRESLTSPTIDGVEPFEQQDRDHSKDVDADLDYPAYPPLGGEHNPVWQNCGVYDAPVKTERVVHSMEHGAVWISYQPDLPADQIETLTSLVGSGLSYLLVAPAAEEQDAPIVLTAWGLQMTADNADDARIDAFIDAYENGPQTPEKGATCAGGETGTL